MAWKRLMRRLRALLRGNPKRKAEVEVSIQVVGLAEAEAGVARLTAALERLSAEGEKALGTLRELERFVNEVEETAKGAMNCATTNSGGHGEAGAVQTEG